MMREEFGVRKVLTVKGSCDLEGTMEGFQKLGRIADGVRFSKVQIHIGMCFQGMRHDCGFLGILCLMHEDKGHNEICVHALQD